jgi:N utilization substance protein B
VGAGAGFRTQQRRRCRAGSARNAADQTPPGKKLIMVENIKKKPVKGPARKANRRGAARLAAVQALYQMDISGAGINDIFAEFESHWLGNEVEGEKYLPAEAAFFRDVVSGVVRDQAKLDPLIDEALSRGWPLKRIDAILRAVLRAGAYELEHRKDVPGRVVVSEYVDVAHAFVEAEETGMVNAVLDQIARQFRGSEFVRAGG